MRTTLDLPEALMADATKDSHQKTRTAAMVMSWCHGVIGAATLLLLLIAPGCRRAEEPVKPPPLATPGNEETALPPGLLAYERPDGVWVRELPAGQPRRLVAEGRWARISPDGRLVAFLRKNEVRVVGVDTGAERLLASVGKGRALAWRPDGVEVWFTDDRRVRAVNVSNGVERVVVDGALCLEIDAAADGRQLVATVKALGGYRLRAWDLAGGRDWSLGHGCSASLDPEGRRVTNNLDGHRELALLDWASGDRVGVVHAPAGVRFDNQFWSNHPDWIAAVTEGASRRVLLLHVPTDRAIFATDEADCDRPDLAVR